MTSCFTMVFAMLPSALMVTAGQRPDQDWRRVQRLEAGSEIVIATKSSEETRHLAAVDAEKLTVANLTHPALPEDVADELLELAEDRSEYYTRAERTTLVFDNVRVAPEGLFVKGVRVAALSEIVERRPRASITEIRHRRRGPGFWGRIGPVGGYFVGAFLGGQIAGRACRAVDGHDCGGAFLQGMVAGGVGGLAYGLYAAGRVTEEVVFRAP